MMVGMPRSRMRLDRLVRLGAIADEIAEVIDRIRRLGVDRRQDGFRRGAVAVQVGEDGDASGHVDVKRARSAIFEKLRKGY